LPSIWHILQCSFLYWLRPLGHNTQLKSVTCLLVSDTCVTCSQMGSLLRVPSLHDISHHCEECSVIQAWSCQRQERWWTNFHMSIHSFIHSFIHPSMHSFMHSFILYIFVFPWGQVHAVLRSFLTVLFWQSAYQVSISDSCHTANHRSAQHNSTNICQLGHDFPMPSCLTICEGTVALSCISGFKQCT